MQADLRAAALNAKAAECAVSPLCCMDYSTLHCFGTQTHYAAYISECAQKQWCRVSPSAAGCRSYQMVPVCAGDPECLCSLAAAHYAVALAPWQPARAGDQCMRLSHMQCDNSPAALISAGLLLLSTSASVCAELAHVHRNMYSNNR